MLLRAALIRANVATTRQLPTIPTKPPVPRSKQETCVRTDLRSRSHLSSQLPLSHDWAPTGASPTQFRRGRSFGRTKERQDEARATALEHGMRRLRSLQTEGPGRRAYEDKGLPCPHAIGRDLECGTFGPIHPRGLRQVSRLSLTYELGIIEVNYDPRPPRSPTLVRRQMKAGTVHCRRVPTAGDVGARKKEWFLWRIDQAAPG
jgi:hypothetical protein